MCVHRLNRFGRHHCVARAHTTLTSPGGARSHTPHTTTPPWMAPHFASKQTTMYNGHRAAKTTSCTLHHSHKKTVNTCLHKQGATPHLKPHNTVGVRQERGRHSQAIAASGGGAATLAVRALTVHHLNVNSADTTAYPQHCSSNLNTTNPYSLTLAYTILLVHCS